MSSKRSPRKPLADVSKPKRRTAVVAAEPKLVIPKRSIIVPVTEEESAEEQEPLQAKPSGKSILPDPSLAQATGDPGTPATSDKAPDESPDEAPAAPAPEAAPEPEPTAEPEPDQEVVPAGAEADDTGEGGDSKPSAKTSAHVRKALEEAKRQQEIQGYIETREFFVPVNTVARKRSIKVSIGLVFLELLLGLVLLNLMLDAGIIELIDKIPHTHFFGVH